MDFSVFLIVVHRFCILYSAFFAYAFCILRLCILHFRRMHHVKNILRLCIPHLCILHFRRMHDIRYMYTMSHASLIVSWLLYNYTIFLLLFQSQQIFYYYIIFYCIVSYCRIFYCIVEYSYIHEYQTNIMQNAYYTIHYSAIFFTSVFFVVQYILQNASCIFQWNISQAVPSRCLHNLYQFYIIVEYSHIHEYQTSIL